MDTINLTENLWNDISVIYTDFIYMKNFKDEEKLAELHKNIDEFIINAENVVNHWNSEFFIIPSIVGSSEILIGFLSLLIFLFLFLGSKIS